MGYAEAIKVLVAHMADPATKLSPSEKREVKRIDECLYAGSVNGYAPLKDMTQLLKSYSRVERHSRTDRAHVVAAFNKLYPGRPAGLLDILADVAACVAGFGEGKEGLLTFDFNEAGDFASFYNDMKFVYALPEQTVPDTTAATGVLARILETLSAIDKRLVALEDRMSAQTISISASSDAAVSNIEEVQQRTGVIINNPQSEDVCTIKDKTYDEMLDIFEGFGGLNKYMVLEYIGYCQKGATFSDICAKSNSGGIAIGSVSGSLNKLLKQKYIAGELINGNGRCFSYSITSEGCKKLSELKTLFAFPTSTKHKILELTPLLSAQLCIRFTRAVGATTPVRRLLPLLIAVDLSDGAIDVGKLTALFGGKASSMLCTEMINNARTGHYLTRSGSRSASSQYKLTCAGVSMLNKLRDIMTELIGHTVTLKECLTGTLAAMAPAPTVFQQHRERKDNARTVLYRTILTALSKSRNPMATSDLATIRSISSLIHTYDIPSYLCKVLGKLHHAGMVTCMGKKPSGKTNTPSKTYSITANGLKAMNLLDTGLNFKSATRYA